MSENVLAKPVDLRVKRSRKYLIDAICTLVREQPLQKISVRDITEKAMVNRSTFYAHFVDKYDLFRIAIGQQMREDLATVLSKATDFTDTNLRTLIIVGGTMMERISNDCQHTAMGELVPVFMNEMQHSIHEIVSSWTNSLALSKSEASTLTLFTTGAIFGASLLWVQQPEGKESIDKVADQIMPLLMEGISRYTN